MGATELGVDMAGPSLPVCPRVATILVLSGSGFNLFQSCDSAVRVTLWCQHRSCFHPTDHLVTAQLSQRCSSSLITSSRSARRGSRYGGNTGHVYTPWISGLLVSYLSKVLILLNTLQITGTHW